MKKGLLSGVIEVESEIKRRLEAERKKAGVWLENIKKEIEEEAVREENSQKEAFHSALEAKKRNAEEKAVEILNKAKLRAARLEELHDEVLREIISQYIVRILPGENHDRPDVES